MFFHFRFSFFHTFLLGAGGRRAIAQSAPWSIAHLPAMMRWLCGIGPDRRPVRGGLPGGRRHLDLDRAQARPSSQRSARHPTRCLGGKRMRALFEVSVSAKLRMAHGFTVMYAAPRWQTSGSPSLHEVSWWHHMKGCLEGSRWASKSSPVISFQRDRGH